MLCVNILSTGCFRAVLSMDVNGGGTVDHDERVHSMLQQVARLEELGPEVCTVEALSKATDYEVQDVKNLMAEAANGKLAAYDNVRHVWVLTTKGLKSI